MLARQMSSAIVGSTMRQQAMRRIVAINGARLASTKTNAPTVDPILYTASATSTGSRASGTAETKQGNLSVKTQFPKELGGKDHTQGTTDPEQLFALAYGTCFLSALGATHKELSPSLAPLPKSTQVRTHVSIGKPSNGLPGFLLSVKIEVLLGPLKEVGLDQAAARKLIEGAHKLCPYSRALAGNIETTITLVEK
ncbi:hypothetical protein OIO90_006170 [Microbotryomycetes sp. JL221]|nr:hypothetical protein OIO90_006170 [Microbotryomycetes sp. JL221]